MVTIKLNNDNELEYTIINYNRNITLENGALQSTGYVHIINKNLDDLTLLLDTTITSIQLKIDNEVALNLQNISAKVNSINESLSGDRIIINVNMEFNI